jgi:hypothetical protein
MIKAVYGNETKYGDRCKRAPLWLMGDFNSRIGETAPVLCASWNSVDPVLSAMGKELIEFMNDHMLTPYNHVNQQNKAEWTNFHSGGSRLWTTSLAIQTVC